MMCDRKLENGGFMPFFANWHGFCKAWGIRRDGPLEMKNERKLPMRAFENVSGRVLAALSSLAFSAFFFAAAIVPASPSLIGSGVIA